MSYLATQRVISHNSVTQYQSKVLEDQKFLKNAQTSSLSTNSCQLVFSEGLNSVQYQSANPDSHTEPSNSQNQFESNDASGDSMLGSSLQIQSVNPNFRGITQDQTKTECEDIDILMIQPISVATNLYQTQELRAKAFIRRHSAFIKKLILIAAINEQMQKQTPPVKLITVGTTKAAQSYYSEFKLICSGKEEPHTETSPLNFISRKASSKRLKKLIRIDSNPHIIQYFSNNLSILEKLHQFKKPLFKEWSSFTNKHNSFSDESSSVLDCSSKKYQRLIEKSFQRPYFVFHLSKRLFSEAALKNQNASVSRKCLNIISSDYVNESIDLISRKIKGGQKSNETDDMGSEVKQDFFACILCSQACDSFQGQNAKVNPNPQIFISAKEWSTCKSCAFNLVYSLLCRDDEGFIKEMAATTLSVLNIQL